MVAALLWLGCLRVLVTLGTAGTARARAPAVAEPIIGLLLCMVGFVSIGGEWLTMWQSTTWNGQQTASGFIAMISVVLIVLLFRGIG